MTISPPSRRIGRRIAAAGGTLALLGGFLAAGGPSGTSASSHREAPLIAGDPAADNTDLYAFVSPDATDTVTMIANWLPFEEPNGGPNFYPWADDTRYNIKIDNDGDALPDLEPRPGVAPTPRHDIDRAAATATARVVAVEVAPLARAAGMTNDREWRTAPSARTLFPIETHRAVRDVEGTEQGLYQLAVRKRSSWSAQAMSTATSGSPA